LYKKFKNYLKIKAGIVTMKAKEMIDSSIPIPSTKESAPKSKNYRKVLKTRLIKISKRPSKNTP